MASYSTMNTVPAADVESETPLMSRDIKVNAKTLIGGAAAAAFALGALAATAVASAPQPAPAALYARAGAVAVDQHVQQALHEQHGLRHGRLPRVRSVQPPVRHVWLRYLHGRADVASDGRAPEPVRQAVHRRQGL